MLSWRNKHASLTTTAAASPKIIKAITATKKIFSNRVTVTAAEISSEFGLYLFAWNQNRLVTVCDVRRHAACELFIIHNDAPCVSCFISPLCIFHFSPPLILSVSPSVFFFVFFTGVRFVQFVCFVGRRRRLTFAEIARHLLHFIAMTHSLNFAVVLASLSLTFACCCCHLLHVDVVDLCFRSSFAIFSKEGILRFPEDSAVIFEHLFLIKCQ